jgi:uncharacterized protein (DUF1810 family)
MNVRRLTRTSGYALGMPTQFRRRYPYRLERFAEAQDSGETYQRAVTELRSGRKRTHWMWFVFPQIAGLGSSAMAERYAISSLDEAKAYLEHPVLGRRLLESARVLCRSANGDSAEEIFGATDAMKLRSSMTLFARAAPDEPLFREILDRYFDGKADSATDERL